MTHLLGQVQYDRERKGVNDTERSVSFLAIGKLAVVAKQDIERYLDDIMQSIKDGLKAKRYQHGAIDTEPHVACSHTRVLTTVYTDSWEC